MYDLLEYSCYTFLACCGKFHPFFFFHLSEALAERERRRKAKNPGLRVRDDHQSQSNGRAVQVLRRLSENRRSDTRKFPSGGLQPSSASVTSFLRFFPKAGGSDTRVHVVTLKMFAGFLAINRSSGHLLWQDCRRTSCFWVGICFELVSASRSCWNLQNHNYFDTFVAAEENKQAGSWHLHRLQIWMCVRKGQSWDGVLNRYRLYYLKNVLKIWNQPHTCYC